MRFGLANMRIPSVAVLMAEKHHPRKPYLPYQDHPRDTSRVERLPKLRDWDTDNQKNNLETKPFPNHPKMARSPSKSA